MPEDQKTAEASEHRNREETIPAEEAAAPAEAAGEPSAPEAGEDREDSAGAESGNLSSAEAEDAAEAAREAAAQPEDGEDALPKIVPKLIPEEEADYEALFLKDAKQRAHDAELAALASLALIRSNRSERNQMLFNFDRDFSISPRMMDRRLHEMDRNAASALLSDIKEELGGKKK